MPFSELIFFFLIIIPSSIIHEYAHAWTADFLGDRTARDAGRLTLNPLAHIDRFGTLLLPLLLIVFRSPFLFAYAKPVPFNPYNLRNGRTGPALVGLAGPASNIVTAIVFGILLRFFGTAGILSELLAIIVYANLLLAVFNFVPIPPLDGSKILFALLPPRLEHIKVAIERYSIFLLLMFVFFFGGILHPVIGALFRLIAGPSVMGL